MDFLHRLHALLPADAIITAPDKLASRLQDERKRFHGQTLAAVLPDSAQQTAAVVKLCREFKVAIVPQAGNTGLVGGATPLAHHSIIICMDRLNRIRSIDAAGYSAIVEAGVILSELKEQVAAQQRLFPMWLGSGQSARIGGLISTNAGGLQVLRYGNMRELVLGLEAVMADGSILNTLYALRKRNAGYDLKQLLIGGEGTLGIITAASLRLMPAERGRATALVTVSDVHQALALFEHARTCAGEVLTAFELITQAAMQLMVSHHPEVRMPFESASKVTVLIELAGSDTDEVLAQKLSEVLDFYDVQDGVIAQDVAQAENLWALRERIPSAQRRAGPSIKQDLALPISAIPDFLISAEDAIRTAMPDVMPIVFGHMGDGNLHYNLTLPHALKSRFAELEAQSNDILFPLARQFGGDISAEHGIGRLRVAAADQYHDPVERSLMRAIKQALDPDGLFNPGVTV
ncbi:FAD-binding oxidoreductase [Burkholderiaceae bacterium DAT-1]|nr:FAD-binding oxidoreductase [Burkholderiaceae bacterium DAT-1]